MPKPKNKEELLVEIDKRFGELDQLIESLGERSEQEFAFDGLNRNVRDVVAHLWEWQLMFLGWYEVGVNGGKPDMPTKGYSWQKLPELNKTIKEKHLGLTLDDARKKLAKSNRDILAIVEKLSNEELFEKKRYPWTGSTSMGAYITSAAWSHFNWATKLIKKHKKTVS